MMKPRLLAVTALSALSLAYASNLALAQDASPAHAYFVNLKSGETVRNPVKVVFGLQGMKVAPAETYEPNTGHFHLLIDTQLSAEEKHYAIPKDDQHLHFGKGQTETSVQLKPGPHTLQIVMGDGKHMLHNPPVISEPITITVKE